MPYKDEHARRMAARERQRKRRAKLKAAKTAPVVALPMRDPVGELRSWAAQNLTIPPGHPLAGQPMTLPDFAADFLRARWTAHESALSVARKNGKSAIAAILALSF